MSRAATTKSNKFHLVFEVLILFIALLLAVFGFIRNVPALVAIPKQVDFAAYYLSARVLNDGGDLYNDELMKSASAKEGNVQYTAYIYLPIFAQLLRPLALVSYFDASRIWLGVNIFLVILSVIILGNHFHFSRIERLLFTITFLLMPQTQETLFFGQVSILINILLIGAMLLSVLQNRSRKSDILAGVLLGFALVIKIYPVVLLLVYLINRRFTILLTAGITMASLVLIPALISGWQDTWQWFFVILADQSHISSFPTNQSIHGVAERLFYQNDFNIPVLSANNHIPVHLIPIISNPVWGLAFKNIGILFILLMSIFFLIKNSKQSYDTSFYNSYAIAAVLMIVLPPNAWDSYLVHLSIPLIVIYVYRQPYIICRYAFALVCLSLVSYRYWRFVLLYVQSPLLMMFGFLAMVITWLALIYIAQYAKSNTLRPGYPL